MTELSLFCWFLGAEEAHDHLPEALPNRSIQMCGVQRSVRLCWDSHFGLQHPERMQEPNFEPEHQQELGVGIAKKAERSFAFFTASFFQAPFI